MKLNSFVRFFKPYRQGLDKKWWHRLSNVLIFGSTVVVVLMSGMFLLNEQIEYWSHVEYVAYSFEPNYLEAKGREVRCLFEVGGLRGDSKTPTIFCGEYSSSSHFLDDYFKYNDFFDRAKANAAGMSDDKIMKSLISEKYLADVKVKEKTIIEYGEVFANILFVFSVVVAWFVFWESIFYRAVLYVVYGLNDAE